MTRIFNSVNLIIWRYEIWSWFDPDPEFLILNNNTKYHSDYISVTSSMTGISSGVSFYADLSHCNIWYWHIKCCLGHTRFVLWMYEWQLSSHDPFDLCALTSLSLYPFILDASSLQIYLKHMMQKAMILKSVLESSYHPFRKMTVHIICCNLLWSHVLS